MEVENQQKWNELIRSSEEKAIDIVAKQGACVMKLFTESKQADRSRETTIIKKMQQLQTANDELRNHIRGISTKIEKIENKIQTIISAMELWENRRKEMEKGNNSALETNEYLTQDSNEFDCLPRPRKLTYIELKKEMAERAEKKPDIIIDGKNVTEEVWKDLVWKHMDILIEDCFFQKNEENTIVRVGSLKDKSRILKRKSALWYMGIKMRDNWTKRQYEILEWIENIAEKEREKGHVVITGYMIMVKNNIKYVWCEAEGKLVLEGRRKKWYDGEK